MSNPRLNPYVGPRAFRTGEKLFGRDRETVELIDLLIAERVVLLHSPSGAGKSSLIYAGLIPRLQEEDFTVLPVIRVNLERPLELAGNDPATSADSLPNRFVLSTMLSLEEDLPEKARTPLAELAQLSLEQYLKLLLEKLRQQSAHKAAASPEYEAYRPTDFVSTVLIFDQFEEVLTVDPTQIDQKLAFFNQLGAVLRDRNQWALFAIREDYLAALDPYLRPIPTRFANTFRLDLLGYDAAHQAIEQPAEQAGVRYEAGAAHKLVDDLRRIQVQQPDGTMVEQFGPYIEPVQLQVVCYRLWECINADQKQITLDDIRNVGDVDQSLAEYYAESCQATAHESGQNEIAIRQWFDRQLITEGGIRSQVMMQAGKSAGLDNRAVRLLQDAHLVRAEKRRNTIWFELAHDRLIGPIRLNNADWFKQNLSLLQRQADRWERDRRPDHLLLRESALAEAEQWAQANQDILTQTEKDFLAACQEMEANQKRMLQLEAERQRAEEKARSAARLRLLLIIAVAAAIVALVFGVIAGNQRQQALANQATAQAASTLAIGNEQIANANARQAQQERDRAATQQILADQARQTAEAARSTAEADRQFALAQEATAQAAKERAETLRAEAEENARLANSRQLAAQALGYQTSNPSLSNLLAIEAYNTSDTWEARNVILTNLQQSLEQGLEPYGLMPGAQPTFNLVVALHPTEPLVAWADTNGTVSLWNFETGTPLWSVRKTSTNSFGHDDRVWGMDFSPDGSVLATGGEDHQVILWNIDTRQGRVIDMGEREIYGVSFDPTGDLLAVASEARVRIYDVRDNPQEVRLSLAMAHRDFLNAVSWSSNGRWIASAGEDGAVKVWEARSGASVQDFQIGGKVIGLDWTSDSRFLAGSTSEHDIVIWDSARWKEVGRLVHDATPDNANRTAVFDVAFVGQGLLASAGNDNRIIAWDVPTLSEQQVLRFGEGQLRSLDARTNRQPNLLASAGTDRMVRLFEVKIQAPLSQEILRYPEPISAILVLPDGQVVAAGKTRSGVRFHGEGNLDVPFDLGSFTNLAFNPQRAQVALGSQTGFLQLLDRSSITTLTPPIQIGTEPVLALAYSPDGSQIASAHCLSEDKETVGTPICTASEIRFWDSQTGNPARDPLTVSSNYIRALAYHPQKPWIAIASGQTIDILDLENGEPVLLPLTAHNAPITSLAYSPDGNLLVSADEDQYAILWHAPTSQPIGKPLILSEVALGLAFDPFGRYFYTGGDKGGLSRWEVGLDSWTTRLCNQAGRNLSAEEIRQFLPDTPADHQTCP